MLPFINIFGKSIPMYTLCIAVGCIIAIIIAARKCKKLNLDWKRAVVIAVCGIGIGFLGAKAMFLLVTYSLSELVDFIASGDFEPIAEGGLVFYGGLIGGLIGAFAGCYICDVKLGAYENVLVPSIPLAHAFGRIGCLCAGCCYGKPVTSGPSVIYQNPLGDAPINEPLAPVQVYEAAYNIIIFIILSLIFRKNKQSKIILPLYIAMYGVGRFIFEYFRDDEIRGVFLGISTSQYISMAMIVAAVVIYLFRTKRRTASEK